jgi:hypothetical protein
MSFMKNATLFCELLFSLDFLTNNLKENIILKILNTFLCHSNDYEN